MNEEKVNTNMTASTVIKIAQEYKEKYRLTGTISNDINSSVKFYNEFYNVDGGAWLVYVDIKPCKYEGDYKLTIVISDKYAKVEYVIDQNGISNYYHLDL